MFVWNLYIVLARAMGLKLEMSSMHSFLYSKMVLLCFQIVSIYLCL